MYSRLIIVGRCVRLSRYLEFILLGASPQSGGLWEQELTKFCVLRDFGRPLLLLEGNARIWQAIFNKLMWSYPQLSSKTIDAFFPPCCPSVIRKRSRDLPFPDSFNCGTLPCLQSFKLDPATISLVIMCISGPLH